MKGYESLDKIIEGMKQEIGEPMGMLSTMVNAALDMLSNIQSAAVELGLTIWASTDSPDKEARFMVKCGDKVLIEGVDGAALVWFLEGYKRCYEYMSNRSDDECKSTSNTDSAE